MRSSQHRPSLTVQIPGRGPRPEGHGLRVGRRVVFFSGGALLGLLLLPLALSPHNAVVRAPAQVAQAAAPTVIRPSLAMTAAATSEAARLVDPSFTVDVSQLPRAPAVDVTSAARTIARPPTRTAHNARPVRAFRPSPPATPPVETNAFDDALSGGRS